MIITGLISALLLISVAINFALWKGANNILKQNSSLEKLLGEFYSQVSITLHNMRVLDEKQMFEHDDEVGEVFGQLVDIINDLRPFIYGSTLANDAKEKSGG